MIDHDRQELTKKKSMKLNDFLQIHSGLSVRSVGKASSIPQITTYQVRTEHLLLKRNLFSNYMRTIMSKCYYHY